MSSAECPDVVKPWTNFFLLVKETEASCKNKDKRITKNGFSTLSSSYPIANNMDFNMTASLEALLRELWTAHVNSISVGLLTFDEELHKLPKPELNFGRSWAGIVDYIAHAFFQCDLVCPLQRFHLNDNKS